MRDFIFATLCLAKICQLSIKLTHVLKSNFLKSCLQISLRWQSCAVDSNITRQRYIIKYTSATTFKNNLYLLFSQNYLPDPSQSPLCLNLHLPPEPGWNLRCPASSSLWSPQFGERAALSLSIYANPFQLSEFFVMKLA